MIIVAGGDLALAQTVGPPLNLGSKSVKEAKLDLSVPESPAFTVMGLTPQTVVRPTGIREFATSLLNGVDRNGNFQTGVAIDTSPYMLFMGDDLTINMYRAENPIRRQLARMQLSFATAKGVSDDDKAVRAAIGLRMTPWDEGDPRMDRELDACFNDAVKLPSGLSFEQVQKFAAEQQAKLPALFETCRKKRQAALWNRSGWTIGLAPGFVSETGNVDSLRGDGFALWTSLAYGFEHLERFAQEFKTLKETSQIIVHARYRSDETVPVPDVKNQFFTQVSSLVGGRLRVGGERLSLSLEGALVHAEPAGRRSDDSVRFSAAVDFRLSALHQNLYGPQC